MIKFDNFGVFFKENSKKAVDAAKETATIAKYNAQIKSEELKLTSAYAEIGKLFCEQADEVDEIFIPLMEKVSDSRAIIAKLEAGLDKLKKTVTCPECGKKSPIGSRFCASCGKEIPVQEDPDEDMIVDEFADDADEIFEEAAEEVIEETTEAVEEAEDIADEVE